MNWIMLAITLLWLMVIAGGCVTDPQVTRNQQRQDIAAAVESAKSQADTILAQAKQDLALANALIEKTKHLNARVTGVPIRTLADVYRSNALQLRSASLRYIQLSVAEKKAAEKNNDPTVKEKLHQRADEFRKKARSLYQRAAHHADLAAHPEKIADELLPPTP